jgi:hypothetical protein
MTQSAFAAQAALNDADFLQQFEAATLAAELFSHLGHVRAAFLFLQREPLILAQRHFASAIQRYAGALGKPEKFHTTVTYALLAVMAARQGIQLCKNWGEFVTSNADLVSDGRALLLNYYTITTLDSDNARRQFVLPDKASLANLMAAG